MSASLFRALALLLFVVSPLVQAKGPAPRIPEQVSNPAWEGDIARFEQADAQSPPPRGAVVFVGSSSIRMWESLASDFPDQVVINRGFGGSEVRDSTWYADRIVLPYKPRLVVFYAGDNDLNAGRTPQQVRDDFVAFVSRVRKGLPNARIAYISIKPSPRARNCCRRSPRPTDSCARPPASSPRSISSTSTRRCWTPMGNRGRSCSAKTSCT